MPYNLIIEVKDGGSNLNNKQSASMKASREKTIEKERLVTDRGDYNYIRLTDNNFAQLLDVFMTIKQKLVEGDDSMTIKINESSIIGNVFTEDANDDISYHLEAIRKGFTDYKNQGGWDEELYSKDMDYAIKNDIKHYYEEGGQTKAYVYTTEDNGNHSKCIGIICVKWHDDTYDWEWVKKFSNNSDENKLIDETFLFDNINFI